MGTEKERSHSKKRQREPGFKKARSEERESQSIPLKGYKKKLHDKEGREQGQGLGRG